MKTEQKKLELTSLYYQILEDPTNLTGTGLFSDERLTEIASYVNENAFEPAKLYDGRIIPNWFCNKITVQIFNDFSMTGGKSHRNKEVLNKLLTPEEIEKFNKYANDLYSQENEKCKFEKAEKLDKASYSGWVYCEGAGYNEGFFESVGDFEDWLGDENDNEELAPEYVWACNERLCLNISAHEIIENGSQEAYEDFDVDDLEGVEEFEKAVNSFMEKNKRHVTYTPDYSRVILLNKNFLTINNQIYPVKVAPPEPTRNPNMNRLENMPE